MSTIKKSKRRSSTRRSKKILDPPPEVVLTGYLTKQGKVVKSWKKRWVVLGNDGYLRYYSNASAASSRPHRPKGWCCLSGCRVEQTSSILGRELAFSILPPAQGCRVYHMFADSKADFDNWLSVLLHETKTRPRQSVISPFSNPPPPGAPGARPSSTTAASVDQDKSNFYCADCVAKSPKFLVATLGILICDLCAEVHKAIAPDSLVFPVFSEEITPEHLRLLTQTGNGMFNRTWEASLPADAVRPNSSTPRPERLDFLQRKYVLKQWRVEKPAFRPATPEIQTSVPIVGEADPIGILDIHLLGAKDLDARGRGSVAPYIVFDLGIQTTKTSVCANSVSPYWNQTLSLCRPSTEQPLTIRVFDSATAPHQCLGFSVCNIYDLVPGILDRRKVPLDECKTGIVEVGLTFNLIGQDAHENLRPEEVIDQLRSELEESRALVRSLRIQLHNQSQKLVPNLLTSATSQNSSPSPASSTASKTPEDLKSSVAQKLQQLSLIHI